MSRKELFKALENDIVRESEAILRDARTQADVIIKKAFDEADLLKKAKSERLSEILERDYLSELSQARHEAKKYVLEAKWNILDRVMSSLREGFITFRAKDDYKSYLKNLLTETLNDCEAPSTITVSPDDRDIMQQLLKDFGLDCRILTSDAVFGGLIMTSDIMKLTLTDTFESRVEKTIPQLMHMLHQILFVGPAHEDKTH